MSPPTGPLMLPPQCPPNSPSCVCPLHVPGCLPDTFQLLLVYLTQSAIWKLSCWARQALAVAFTHEPFIHSLPFISLESLLTIGRLLVHEYMMSFHLPKSSLISLNNVYCTDCLLLLLNLFLSISFFTLMLLEVNCWDFPSGPVVGTWSFPARGMGLIPSQGTQFSSVARLCLTLCDPMDCSTPVLPVHRQLLEFVQVRVHQISDSIQPSHPLPPSSPFTLNLSQHQALFQ